MNSQDALMYSVIENNIADPDKVKLLASLAGGPSNISLNESEAYINNLLSDTTIKRANCHGKSFITVKIPIPSDFDSKNLNETEKKYGFLTKQIEIPTSIKQKFTSFYPGSTDCNNFYKAYCENVKQFYKYDAANLPIYSPECACYGNTDYTLQQHNVAPLCYMPQCSYSNEKAYLDPMSRIIKNCKKDCDRMEGLPSYLIDNKTYVNTIIDNCGHVLSTVPPVPGIPSPSVPPVPGIPPPSSPTTPNTPSPSNPPVNPNPAPAPINPPNNSPNIPKKPNTTASIISLIIVVILLIGIIIFAIYKMKT